MADKFEFDIPHHLAAMLNASVDAHMEALDLGCGVGHMLTALDGRVARATGVDTSGTKLAIAAQSGYDALVQDDVLEFCAQCEAQFDLVLAAKVLIYFSQLDRLFAEVHRVLVPGGHFAFSVKGSETTGAQQGSGYFNHSLTYLMQLAHERFEIVDSRMVRISNEPGRSMLGLFQVWKRF